MSRVRAFLIVVLLWAAIYLPGLGSTEIKGEEGRRILPAITMLDHGGWLVPHVGGKPFLRKPPLVNWLIAASFHVLNRRDEWAARLPSALAVLSLAGVMLLVSRERAKSILTTDVAFIAALFFMTFAGLLAKARFAGAEIEGIYVPLAGMAIITWLAFYEQRRSPWQTWLVPFVFLALAVLAKGPLHLLFFYAIVIAVLYKQNELSLIKKAPHFVGIALLLVIVGLWAVPYFLQRPDAAGVLNDQFVGRVTDNPFDVKSYLLNIPRGLSDALPWLLFMPILWSRRKKWLGREGNVVRGVLLAFLVCFFGLLLIPGVLTRYVLPLSVPLSLLLAIAIADEKLEPPRTALRYWWHANAGAALGILALALVAPPLVVLGEKRHLHVVGERFDGPATLLVWPLLASSVVIIVCLVVLIGRNRLARPTRIAGASAALLGAGSLLYAADAVPFIKHTDTLRPLGADITAAIPKGERLCLFQVEYLPVIFYLRVPCTYANAVSEIPPDVRYVIIREGTGNKLATDFDTIEDYRPRDKAKLLLLRRKS